MSHAVQERKMMVINKCNEYKLLTKHCHILWLFRNNGYYQITFFEKKKKKEKKIPFERGDIIIVLRIAVIVHTHKKPQYILNMHYPYPSNTKMHPKQKKKKTARKMMVFW